VRLPGLAKLDEHTLEVVRGASAALLLRVLGAILTFLLNVLVARMFGASGVGVFFLAFTVMSIASVLGRLGLDNTVLRFVASGAALGDWNAVAGVHRKSLLLAGAASIAASAAMAVTAPVLAAQVFEAPELSTALQWFALAVPAVAMSTLYSQALRGLKRSWASMLVSTVSTPGLALLLLLLLGPKGGPAAAARAYTVAATATAIGAWWWWRRVTPQLRSVRGSFDTTRLLASSVPLLWVASMSLAMNWIATFALGIAGSTEQVGVFNAASRVSFLVSFVLVAVDNISAPKFAALYEAGDRVALASTARYAARLMAFLAVPLLVLCVAFPGAIMSVFGPEFQSSGAILAVLAIAQATNVLSGSVGYLLMMSGHERQVRTSNAIAASTCLILSIALAPRFGAFGAAVAVGIALLARNIYETVMVRRYLGIGALLFSGSDR
jgi:O-antigen/teichoic acid export membrane protein